jgi:hypothetical protein
LRDGENAIVMKKILAIALYVLAGLVAAAYAEHPRTTHLDHQVQAAR